MFRRRRLSILLILLVAAGSHTAPADDGTESGQDGGIVLEIVECRVLFVRKVPLASDQVGILTEVVEEGRWVEKGQVVARLQDDVARSALAVAKARATSDVDVRLAEKEHAQALAEYEAGLAANREAGGNRPAYPETEITRRRLASEAAELRVEQAKRDLEVLRESEAQAAAELDAYSVICPVNGVVVRSLKEVGEGVQQVEPILEVVNADTMRVEGFVPLEDVAQLEVGMPVQAYVDLSGSAGPSDIPLSASERREAGPYAGQIGFIDLAIQPVARSVRVWADVENSDGQLRDGMTARLEIPLPSGGAQSND